MKTIFTTLFFVIASSICFAQTWTQKNNFVGTPRTYAVGFSIGTKGYVGTGQDTSSTNFYKKDFWEWDQASDSWTQKADFGGLGRNSAIGFSIGTKGYIGTGYTTSFLVTNDFWEWNQFNNTWTQKASLPASGRYGAVGFSIGTMGYIGTGYDASNTYFSDFWEWNQSNNTWMQKASFPGALRDGAVGFSIGLKGYIGTGHHLSNNFQDFWEWDQATNLWTQKANFQGTSRFDAVGFSIYGYGYIATGYNNGIYYQDVWEWNQWNDTWTQKTNFNGSPRFGSVAFSIGNCGYIGTGNDTISTQDFWECCSLLSVEGYLNEKDIILYPSVSNGFFNLIVKKSELKIQALDVYNVTGEKVCSIHNTEVIDISNQPNGIYFLQIKTTQGIVVKKIVVQR